MSDYIKSTGCYALISAVDLVASKDFYRRLVGFVSVWENDWFVLLQAADRPEAQLAFIHPDHDSLPETFRSVTPAGVVVTVEVSDATQALQRAKTEGIAILQDLRDEAFGQRHFMVVDPNGLLVDVVQQIFVADPNTV